MNLTQNQRSMVRFIDKHTDEYKDRTKVGGLNRQQMLRTGRQLRDLGLVNYHDRGWYFFTEEGKKIAEQLRQVGPNT